MFNWLRKLFKRDPPGIKPDETDENVIIEKLRDAEFDPPAWNQKDLGEILNEMEKDFERDHPPVSSKENSVGGIQSAGRDLYEAFHKGESTK